MQHPVREVIQADGRIRRWAPIQEMGGRHLRVVVLVDGETVHNALRSFVHAMKIEYFQGSDTLYIELGTGDVAETKDLDENTQIDLDRGGQICAITIEHAKTRVDLAHFSFEQVGT